MCSEAVGDVVVDHPGGLHEGVGRGRTHEREATSAIVAGRGRPSPGAKDHSRSDNPSGSSWAARALRMAAAIFARLRTMPASAISRASSSGPNSATVSMAKPANADRKAGRLRKIVIHDRPDWNASSVSRSNSP